ncbi:monofunctional biosynthetic peptidoglycan transglycosylase, partial [Vineibacter terrae]|uniref:monofunctional biosynthetic peptidoglycan transglycosylase n=1 Tax=Vineibacter terrae TaxID=2586908 RepID=UPI002E35143B
RSLEQTLPRDMNTRLLTAWMRGRRGRPARSCPMPCPEAADNVRAQAINEAPISCPITAPPTPITVRPSSGRAWARRLLHGAAVAVAALLLLPVVLTGLYRFVPPPATPLMVIRTFEGDGASRTWVALDALPDAMPLAVMAAEDNRFCRHHGFDWGAIAEAIEDAQAGERLRGASTISMQLTRNLFLWPGGGWPRKALEALWTPMVELLLGKQRIIELYLNVAETGRGIFGVEAAARRYYGKSAAALSARQAAGIAAILPDPRDWSPDRGYAAHRVPVLLRRMRNIAPLATCVTG